MRYNYSSCQNRLAQLRIWYLNMNITATLNEIATLSIEERIDLVQAIWDSIAAEQIYPDLTETQKQELDRRIEDSEANPDNIYRIVSSRIIVTAIFHGRRDPKSWQKRN